MPYGLYLSAEGANAQAKRLEVLANNLANVNTTAFKRDVPIFQARFAEAIANGNLAPDLGGLEDIGGGIRFEETRIDFSPGPLRQTGKPSDLAIRGDGFFVVQKEGVNHLTRDGSFQIDPNGALVNADGYPVLSDALTPVVIAPDAGPWTVSPDGTIVQAGGSTPLALVRPQQPGDLVKQGENLYASLTPPIPLEPAERQVATQFLESSGVQPTSEMMELIEASRAFEANTAMIKHQDAMIGNLVGRLLHEG